MTEVSLDTLGPIDYLAVECPVGANAEIGQVVDDEMVWIPDGVFSVGSKSRYPDERRVRKVEVSGFRINPAPVTNARFADFVDETGHVTRADVAPDSEQYP